MEFIKDYTADSTMQLLIRLPHHRRLLLPSVACRELISFRNTHEKGTIGLPSTEPQINICFTRGTAEIYTRLDTFGNPILCTGGLPSSRCLLNNGTVSKLECISGFRACVCVLCSVAGIRKAMIWMLRKETTVSDFCDNTRNDGAPGRGRRRAAKCRSEGAHPHS